MVLGSSPAAVTSPSDFAPASSKEFLDIQATIEDGFTLIRIRDMTRRYSQHQWLLIAILQSSCHTQPHAITVSMGIVRVHLKPQPLNVHSATYHYKNQPSINENAGSYTLFMEYLPREDHSQNNYNKTMNKMLEKIY